LLLFVVVRADGLTGLMHRNWQGQGEDLDGVDFDQFFAWISMPTI